ncbi:hypothetical protein DVH05_000196 [Phytophthora capsici]|nr:hypothetical protein DVH05_000196 [Phytophthora capsici]
MSASEPERMSRRVWEAPPIAKEWHESWKSFNQYMEKYQADTHQLIKMRTSTSVSRRKTYWIKLICTRAACKADVKASVTWNQDEGKFMVRVTNSNPVHNHRVDEASYDNHPSVRRVEDPVDTAGSIHVPQGTPEPAGVPQGITGSPGVSEDAEEEAAAADNTLSFTLTKILKSGGRPKVRKQQKAPAKKRRMSLGMQTHRTSALRYQLSCVVA